MKQIINKTILKQGDKTYQPIEVDGVIYWVDKISQIIVGDWYSEMVMGKVLFTHKMKEESLIGWNESEHTKNSFKARCSKIVAQSEPKLDDAPVIEIGPTGFDEFEYTQADIEKAIELAREADSIEGTVDLDVVLCYGSNDDLRTKWTKEEILEQINSISVIEVDEDFNVLGYELCF